MPINLLKEWINPVFVGLLILLSLPIKLPFLQEFIESFLSFSLPIKLSLYTIFLPPIAICCITWNRKRAKEIWDKLSLPLMVLGFLFVWMWLGAIMSEYPRIALKHSGRYSIFLLTFVSFIFAIDSKSSKKITQIFSLVFILLMVITFLDWNQQISLISIIEDMGMKIDLFFRRTSTHGPSSFFENRNPFAIVSICMLFWYIYNLRNFKLLSSLGIIVSLWSFTITGSRNGLFTLFVCILFLLFFYFKRISKKRLILLFFIGSVILTFTVNSGVNSLLMERTKNSINELFKIKKVDDLKKLDRRFSLYSSTINIGLEKMPILGSGTKTSGHILIDDSIEFKDINNEWYKNAFNAHNALLTVWIEMGLIGLIAVLSFLWLWFRPAFQKSGLLIIPSLAACVGQIFDYFVWEILFMAFQSFLFAHLASVLFFFEEKNN